MTEPSPRIEPSLGNPDAIKLSVEEPSFMRAAREREQRPGPVLWVATGALLLGLVVWNLAFNLPERAGVGYAIGAVVGSLFWPGMVLGAALLFDSGRSLRSCFKVVAITCAASLLILATHLLTVRGYAQRWFNHEQLTAADFERLAGECALAQDLACEEANWRDYVRLRPDDARGAAWLGRTLNQRGKDEEAVAEFRRALSAGAGGYDVFAYYADSLHKLGRNDEAIEWSYRALSVDVRLVDVRGKLAQLLVAARRPYEALALLQAHDEWLASRGQPAFFSAQRMAIESGLARVPAADTPELGSLRVPAVHAHYIVPVTLADARPWAFVVDTGATVTTLSERLLRDAKVAYRVVDPEARMRTADGRMVAARAIVIDALRVGPFELTNVPAVVCADCVALLGQSTLSRFDLRSERAQGTDFIWLTPRAAR